MRIHYLQHVPFEGLENIENWSLSKGHRISDAESRDDRGKHYNRKRIENKGGVG